jgi:hypothetical protein
MAPAFGRGGRMGGFPLAIQLGVDDNPAMTSEIGSPAEQSRTGITGANRATVNHFSAEGFGTLFGYCGRRL